MRGRKPKPRELKVLRDERADRIPARPVDQTSGEPDVPANLDADARAEYDRITSELRSLGVLARTDRAVLGLYLDAWLARRDAERSIQSLGLILNTTLGGVKTNPAAAVASTSRALMLRILAELGLTPTARARLTSPVAPPDELDSFLAKAKAKGAAR
jgi:P27 family predicted phage terminase small subunit